MKTARDIMTSPVKTVAADLPLRDVAALFAHAQISGAPVVDPATGALMGVVSESDLLDPEKRQAALPRFAVFGLISVPDDLFRRAYEDGWKLPASAVMTRRVVTVDEDATVTEISSLLVRRKINRLPVVRGGDGSVAGIVTREDVLRALRGEPRPAAGPNVSNTETLR